MNTCKKCGREFKSKQALGGHVLYCIYGGNLAPKKITIEKHCLKCGKLFSVQRSIKNEQEVIRKKEKKYCSLFCSHTRIVSEETKEKIKKSLSLSPLKQKQCKKVEERRCISCGKIISKQGNTGMCFSCNVSTGNLKTLASYRRNALFTRSKNEIAFFDMCSKEWSFVFANPKMFYGFDADIVLIDYHVAILWNGVWHYKSIRGEENLKRVQARDTEKTKAIKDCGFLVYCIEDEGKEDLEFVEKEFLKLKNFLEVRS